MAKVMQTGSNSQAIRLHNRLLVRDTIRKSGPLSRRDVARMTGLTPSAVTGIVNDLVRIGVVQEIGRGESSGGRKPVLLELNPRAGYIFAVRLQSGETVAALIDLGGNILSKQQKKLDTNSPDKVVEAIVDAFTSMIAGSGVDVDDVLWCGIASPGLVDSAVGLIERSTNLNWNKVHLAEMLAARLPGMPVHVENISNAAALAEKEFGSGRGCPNLLYINLSVGIGAGIVIGGSIYGGACGYAGEVGHIILDRDGGPLCTCGARGCFEAICGVHNVLRRVMAEIPDEAFARLGIVKTKITFGDIIATPLAEISPVQDIIRETGCYTGMAVADLISIFNPNMVILGGELPRAGEIFLEAVERMVKERIPSQIKEAVQIVRSNMAEDPPLMGAYALALEKVFALEDWGIRRSAGGAIPGESVGAAAAR